METRPVASASTPFAQVFGAWLLAVGLTLPYYICVSYRAWFVDEGFAIYRNPDAKGETPILEVLRHDFWGTSLNPPEGYITHKSWRPLITLMYAAEWVLCGRWGFAGAEMRPMRLVSCLVHSLNAGLVLAVLRLLQLPLKWSCLGACLFAAHPIHIENIVYLVGRADSFSTTFYLLALIAYLRLCWRTKTPGAGTYLLLGVLNVLSGLCKEPGFTCLFFLFCVELALRCRSRVWVLLLALFGLCAAARTWYVGGTEAGFGYVDTPIRYQDDRLHGSVRQALLVRTLSYLFQHGYYAKLLILPWNQSWDYSYESLPMVTTLTDLRLQLVLLSYLAVAALACHGLRLRARSPGILLGLGLVVVPFVPMSNLFFLVGTTIGERLLYPLTAGWALIAAALGARSPRLFWPWLALLAVYVVNSNLRMADWESPAVLFMQDAEHWQGSVKVLHAKASELQAAGDLQGALDFYQRSLDIFDDQAITDYCIARILINLDRFQEAYERFDKILAGHGIGLHDGNDFLWMTDLGYLLTRVGQDTQGVHYLEEGLRRMPWSCYAWNALGIAQARQGQLEPALQSLNQGLQCDPESALLWSNLAAIYFYGQAPELALQALQEALKHNASQPAVQHNAQALQGRGEPILEFFIPFPGRGGLGPTHDASSPLRALAEVGLDRFAFRLEAPIGGVNGEAAFGALPTHWINGPTEWVPLVPEAEEEGYWLVEVLAVSVGGRVLQNCTRMSEGCRAAVDTGSGDIMGPKDIVNHLLAILAVKEDCSLTDLAPVHFQLRGEGRTVTLTLEPVDYVDWSEGFCEVSISSVEMPLEKPQLWVLGHPLLRRYVSAYDLPQRRVGFTRAARTADAADAVAAAGAEMAKARARAKRRARAASRLGRLHILPSEAASEP